MSKNSIKKTTIEKNRKRRLCHFSVITQAEELIRNNNNISRFLYTYISCEVSCKQIISVISNRNRDDIKMDMRVIKRSLKHYGVTMNDSVINQIFGSEDKRGKKTCRKLRNELVHRMSKNDIIEINDRIDTLMFTMDAFIKAIRSVA